MLDKEFLTASDAIAAILYAEIPLNNERRPL